MKSEQSDYGFMGSPDLAVSHWNAVKETVGNINGVLSEDLNYHKTHEIYQMLTMSPHDKKLQLPVFLARKNSFCTLA